MPYEDFLEDLDNGKKGERIVTDFLKTKGLIFVKENDDYRHDITMIKNGKEVKYEIKTDYKQTPNHFVEFRSSTDYGKTYSDSGIVKSKSEWYVFYYTMFGEVWFIKTEKLRELIKNNNFETKYQVKKPATPAQGYLINRNDFKEHFNVYKL